MYIVDNFIHSVHLEITNVSSVLVCTYWSFKTIVRCTKLDKCTRFYLTSHLPSCQSLLLSASQLENRWSSGLENIVSRPVGLQPIEMLKYWLIRLEIKNYLFIFRLSVRPRQCKRIKTTFVPLLQLKLPTEYQYYNDVLILWYARRTHRCHNKKKPT